MSIIDEYINDTPVSITTVNFRTLLSLQKETPHSILSIKSAPTTATLIINMHTYRKRIQTVLLLNLFVLTFLDYNYISISDS